MRTLLKLLAVGIAATSTSLVLLATGVLPSKSLYTAQINLPNIVHHSRSAQTAFQTFSPDQQGEVLGIATSRTTQQGKTADQVVTLSQLNQRFDEYTRFLASFGLTASAPSTNLPPTAPAQASATTGITGLVSNNNGQTTAVIGGNPIVTYVAPVPTSNLSGTSLAGFGSLSAGTFASGNSTISGNLNVSGPVSASSLSSSGDATIAGAFSAATSTLSTLTVSGPATFTGSTTIAGLTVTGLNPGLTQGSVAFQGASALSQDNANLFYDAVNHRLGLGTTTPPQSLTLVGNELIAGNATTTGSAQVAGAFTVVGASSLATTTVTNLTDIGPATLQSTLSVTATSTLATTTITNLMISQAPTISAFNTGILHSNSSGLLSSTAVNLSTGDVTGILPVANGGIATTTLGSLTVGSNLSITGGQQVLIGTSTTISLGSNVVTTLATGTAGNIFNGSIAANALTLNLPFANGVNTGQLQAADWITFNNKLGGPGTNGYVVRYTGASTTATGILLDNGTVAGVNATSPTIAWNVQGSSTLDPFQVASSNASSLLMVKATGNVGIGTMSPAAALDIKPVANVNPFNVSSSTGTSEFTINSGGNVVMTGSLTAGSITPTIIDPVNGISSPGLTYTGLTVGNLPAATGGANLFSTQTFTAWNKGDVTVTGGISDPDGGSNAYRLTEGSTSGNHYTYLGATGPSSGIYKITVRAKAGSRQYLLVDMMADSSEPQAIYNLSSGTVTSFSAGVTATITADGNGYYLVTFQRTLVNPSISWVIIAPSLGSGGAGYQGNGTGYLDVYQPTLKQITSTIALNTTRMVTDGINTQDCSVGGGSFRLLCVWNGATWNPIMSSSGVHYATAFINSNATTASPLVFVGDSLTTGGYPALVAPTWTFTSTNLGVSGKTALAMLADEPTNVAPLYAPQARWNIAMILAGTNDAATGRTADQTITSLLALHSNARRYGFKTVASTITPCGTCSGGAQTVISTVNSYIRNNWALLPMRSWIWANDPHLSDPTNSTYYTDQVHWTPAGNAVVAGLVTTAINQITGGTASPLSISWSSGSVGIGSTSPSNSLTVQAAANVNPFYVASSSGASDMVILSNGNVGIGTTLPQYLLHVGSASVASGTVARFQNANGTCDINPTTNTLACSSDERLKKNITSMTDDLAKVMDLQPVYFNWNAEDAGSPEHPGFIAQQVQQVMPEVVSADPTTGLLSIGYSDLVPAVVGAMQQMQAEITTLQGSLTGNATTSNLTVYDPANFSGDSVGEARILAGQTSVRVAFWQAYSQQPIVTVTPEDVSFSGAYVSDRDARGFAIAIPSATTTDVDLRLAFLC